MKSNILFLFFVSICVFSTTITAQTTTLVSVDGNGRLVYTADSKGNKVPDFSGVGYKNSEVSIPTVPVVKMVTAIAGDNLLSVQAAINEVAALPMDGNGIRGAILFKAGLYNISDVLNINASGIVLRGEGTGSTGTRFMATKTAQHTLFTFEGLIQTSYISSTKKSITDNYVPIGATAVTVASGHSFQVGDRVYLHRIPNQAWVDLLTMAQWGWTYSAYDVDFDRVVKAVNGNIITLDAPVMDIIDPLYATGELVKYNSSRIENCGIENMRISSSYVSSTDENHGWEAVSFNNIINSWATNIEVYYFGYSAVHVLDGASWITIDNCKMYDAKSVIDGGRRYSFNVDGQRVLVKNCITRNGRHDYVNGSRTNGPVVFYNCSSTLQNNDIGPHHRWSTGILYDNIVGDGRINAQNRTSSGTGHGWAGAQIMFWNCTAARMAIQDPQGDCRNWAIGCVCPDITNVGDMTTEPLGFIESQGTKITAIPSLFIAQLNQRLYGTTPVELVQFELRKKRQSVILNWATASEKDNQFFIVEHAVNGKDFTQIETISSKGNGSALRKYSFEHTYPVDGMNYYRLKQVDIDGKYTYSDIKTIDMPRKVLSLSSPLISDVLHIFLAGSFPVDYRIVSASGQQVAFGKSIGSTKIGLSKQPVGWYYVITGNGESASFFKVH
jgi:hypothetical protein